MANHQQDSNSETTKQDQSQILQAPSISLPKGGGAIKGIGEKFSANPVTGTGSMSVPIAASPGRSGFGPQLALNYDSGAGNGPFGIGWNLSLPQISRRTDRGIPRYDDEHDSDIFLLSGAEDLVLHEEQPPNFKFGAITYRIRRYRPRIEGLFALIEYWTDDSDPKETFWRSISKDNITTWYGKTSESRIANPNDVAQVFAWLVCETHDDKGNVMVYHYQAEDGQKLDFRQAHERNRNTDTIVANRYVKSIRYGNKSPYLSDIGHQGPMTSPPDVLDADANKNCWMFELAFEYREDKAPVASDRWTRRIDPFSSYRSGFEIRTYRLCQRVLMFHHFDELGEEPYLVKSTDFTYQLATDLSDPNAPGYSDVSTLNRTHS
jgi:hypothetical protein